LIHAVPWLIRPLRQGDLSLFRPLRLEALRQHPDAFGSSVEDEQDSDMSRWFGEPPNVTLGGFVNDEMVGSAGLIVSPKLKQRHKGHIVGVYVAPGWRRTGLARALLDRLIQEARTSGLVLLTLTVATGNVSAQRIYESAGFSAYGVEPRSLRVGSVFLDEALMALRLD
jgi:ribosomal protein S18 acetylase RimI-like enzyme